MHFEEIISKIDQNKIKVTSKKQLTSYVNKYGYYRIIDCYGAYLSFHTNKKITTKHIISLFEFDKKLANMLASHLFDFEQQLNSIAIQEICQYNNLPDDYVLTITNNPAYSSLRKKGFADFVNEIYENVKSCNLIGDCDPKSLPLKILSVSWSFHTLISFIYLQDEQIIININNRFHLQPASYHDFISICHSIRKFRNILSHNGMFFASKLNFYCREFNQVVNTNCGVNFPIDSDINIYKLIILLEKLLSTSLLNKDFKKIMSNLKLPKKIKHSLLRDIGFIF